MNGATLIIVGIVWWILIYILIIDPYTRKWIRKRCNKFLKRFDKWRVYDDVEEYFGV